MTKRYHRKLTSALSLVLPVILVFAILNCFTTYVFYEDYKYKMNLMTEIAAKEEVSGLDAVSELLKDKDIETNEQGRRLLEQYAGGNGSDPQKDRKKCLCNDDYSADEQRRQKDGQDGKRSCLAGSEKNAAF